MFCNLNVKLSAYPSAMSDYVKIGEIANWSAVSSALITVPCQSDGSKVMAFNIDTNGNIRIFSSTGLTVGEFYRAFVAVPVA